MEEDREKLQQYASKILTVVRDGLVARYPFLARAVYELQNLPTDEQVTGTDGQHFLYGAEGLVTDYAKERTDMEEIYLHSVLHCLYLHPFLTGKKNRTLWDIACDIYIWSVENLLKGQETARSSDTRRLALEELQQQVKILSAQSIYRFLEKGGNAEWTGLYSAAQLADLFRVDDHSMWYVDGESRQQTKGGSEVKVADRKHVGENGEAYSGEEYGGAAENDGEHSKGGERSADGRSADEGNTESCGAGNGSIEEDNFTGDDGTGGEEASGTGSDNMDTGGTGTSAIGTNSMGTVCTGTDATGSTGEPTGQSEELMRRWGDIAEYAEAGFRLKLSERMLGQEDQAGGFLESLRNIEREAEDYASFLQKFAILEERMQIDQDAFDFIYYTYGMELFHDTPLIEPLEYKEMKTIHEFVIAIDTSGSCDLSLIRRFLTKTFDILHTSTIFQGELRIYIMQCDAVIQQELLITEMDELRKYADHMEIHGRGGTDFRPVFWRIEELREAGELTDIRGLLYFTDGYGTYPVKPTDYKTAFVFAQMDEKVSVPSWAMRISIDDIADLG